MTGRQSWITFASDDHEALKAIILARSLKRVITRRSLTAFVSHQVSEYIGSLLQDEFHTCIRMSKLKCQQYEENNVPFAKIALIQSWGLTHLTKFVFLDCTCMVVRNSDELFHTVGICAPNEIQWGDGKTPLIVDKPSSNLFKDMSAFYKGDSSKKIIWSMDNFPLLDEKYLVSVNLKKNTLARDTRDINILQFPKLHPMEIFVNHIDQGYRISDAGVMEKQVIAVFHDLLTQNDLLEKIAVHTEVHHDVLTSYIENYKPTSTALPMLSVDSEELKDSIAIVGMAFRLPGANNPDEFWDLLIKEKEGIIKVPDFRWNDDQCFTRDEGTKETEAGFLNVPIDGIDGKFFGLSPKDLALMDPQQRLVLEVVWESLEHACINPDTLKAVKAGVFGGWWKNDYKEILQEMGLNLKSREFFRTYMGNSLGNMTGRISHILDTTGPSISTESGCSTSIVAVDMACKSLANEDCDLGVAFGVNLLLHPFRFHLLNNVIAVDGRSKTFDADADGFGRAEGCTALILKRFPDAVRDKDRIWGLIRGSAVVQEGPSRSMGTPTVQCEALAMQLALERAGVEPNEVSFIEAHGTGTTVGDPLEIAAISEVYSKGRKDPLTIGSVKTNVGHTESCSGITGIIKTVLSMKNQMIPKHLNFKKLNPEINLESIPAQIPISPVKWEKNPGGRPRFAGVSSFGITGTDAHVIVQETPDPISQGLNIKSDPPLHIMKASAKCTESLSEIKKAYKSLLLGSENDDLKDISFSANVGRGDYSYRCFGIGQNGNELTKSFDTIIEPKQIPKEPPKICFLFTGQGSQYPGMAKSLYDSNPTFKMHFDICDRILKSQFKISIKEAMWGEQTDVLKRTIYSQTSIFCVEYCLLKLWESWGITPDYVLGHSLGEFAASVAAGILTFEDALILVAERSRLIDSLPRGKMLVIKENVETVKDLMDKVYPKNGKWLDYAAVNALDQTVLAGTEETINHFATFCDNNRIKTHVLEATHAFHSRHMDPILDEYREIASSLNYSRPKCVFVSGMEGKIMEKDEVDAEYWVQHTRKGVQFLEANKAVLKNDCKFFLEVGPHPVLSALTVMNSDTVEISTPIICLPSLRKKESEWTTILNTLGRLYVEGFNLNWENFHQYSSAKKITLPFYPFQKKSFWFEDKGYKERHFHPLVGTPVPNPSNLKMFCNNIDLDNAMFLRDHVIGSTIVFPGAGFLEMCMVSAYAAGHCIEGSYVPPSTPMTIEDFTIEAPLALYDGELCQVQEIVTTEHNGETRVTVYSKLVLDKENSKWIRHASGVFSPYAVQSKGTELYKDDTLEDIKARCQEKIKTDETYDKLTEFGLHFGQTFRTLRSGWKGDGEAYCEVAVTESPKSYICHPVLIDAMFQVMVMTSSMKEQLHVPVSVSKFIWYSKITTDTCYIYVHFENKKDAENRESNMDSEIFAVLYDSNGKKIAVMVSPTFIDTTVTTIMSVIASQRTLLPTMYEDVWRHQLGPLEKRCPPLASKISEQLPHVDHFNALDTIDQNFYDLSNRLYYLSNIKSLVNLGWDIHPGETFKLTDCRISLKILPELEDFLRSVFMEFAEEGLLRIIDWNRETMEFETVQELPSINSLNDEINSVLSKLEENHPQNELEIASMLPVTNNLTDILIGKQSPLAIIFPENSDRMGPAEIYYKESQCNKYVTRQSKELLMPLLINPDTQLILEETKSIARILEIGAGTGSCTKYFVNSLAKSPQSYEYTYTDISKVFFSYGEKIFKDSKMKVIYKTLNIEKDPTTQGFIPQQYDIICASFVLHATRDIRESLTNIKNLLKPGGMLIIQEFTKPTRVTNLLFGTLDGFHRFVDYDLRPYHCIIDEYKWMELFQEFGFEYSANFNAYLDEITTIIATAPPSSDCWRYVDQYLPVEERKTWLVFSDGNDYLQEKLSQVGKRLLIVQSSSTGEFEHLDSNGWRIRRSDFSDITTVFDDLKRRNIKLEGIIYLWGYESTQKDYQVICEPFFNLCKCLIHYDHTKLYVFTKQTHAIGDHEVNPPHPSPLWGIAKAISNECNHITVRCVDLDPSNCSEEDMFANAFSELFMDNLEHAVAYRGNQRHVCRMIPCKIPKTALTFPKSNRFHAVLPSSNAIPDLKFCPCEAKPLKENEVEVQVKAYGLNFKDVLTILKPTSDFDNMNTLGIDYAGVVTAVGSSVKLRKVGDPVFGFNIDGGAYPSHLNIDEELTMIIPRAFNYWEAATLPAVAATAYVCLIKTAKLKKNETILIHTGSGGVGLVAIQIAQSLNCNIVTTAGSSRKRAYLRNLGIKHVFHSRNTNYEKDIREALGGRGVDVVLNSLTGNGFKEASLSVCNEGARFIEMSLINTWTKEEVAAIRPDVFYEQVLLHKESQSDFKTYMTQVTQYLGSNAIKPIPFVRFDASEIRGALTYMQKAKHIGKIVCIMPEPTLNKIGGDMKIPLFNDQSSYLITGGFGGIGIEVAKWMVDTGAKNLILVGRNPPKDKAAEEIQKLISLGINVLAVQSDIGDFQQCQSLLDTIKDPINNLPVLRGIMHSAGVLCDALYENLTWDKFETVFNAKVKGGWNLHQLTLEYPMEHFVMFSSIVGLLGSIGQANHCSANVFLDCLTEYRHSIGLPATTVNWGHWGQVGVATDIEVAGMKPMTTLQTIGALDAIMRAQRLQTCVCEMDVNTIKKAVHFKEYLSELNFGHDDSASNIQINSEAFWKEYDAVGEEEQKAQVIKKYLHLVIRQVLRLDPSDAINDEANFQDMGMDSLMMIEMKNSMQTAFGARVKIPLSAVKDCSNVNQLATRLVQNISGGDETPPPTRDELVQLIREDSQLAPEITPSGKACKIAEIRTVFITGVTGNFGPYVLREICKQRNIQKIFCLMRPSIQNTPDDRLKKLLTDKGMLSDVPLEIVECVVGNVSKEKFGLSDEIYSMLSEQVDAVFHLSVKADVQEIYRKTKSFCEDSRTVNVIGTKNVLSFACSNKTKHLYYSSTIMAVYNIDEDERLKEDWPNVHDFDNYVNSAYPISKFICDLLMSQAVERGVPCKVFRFPFMGVDSKTGGNVTILTNQLLVRMMGYMFTGMIPAAGIPFSIMPVDICAEFASRIFFSDETGFEAYHVCNPLANDEQELEDIAEELGYPVDVVEPDEFIEKVEKMDGENEIVMFLKNLVQRSKDERQFMEMHMPEDFIRAWATNKENFFRSKKLANLIPEYSNLKHTSLELLKKDLQFAKDTGIFAKAGFALDRKKKRESSGGGGQ